MGENPFTPSFGEVPLHLAGRAETIRLFQRAFDSGNRRPELTTIFSGARGTGKTALMAYLADCADRSGWIAVRTTALPGMMEDIEIQLRRKAAHLLGDQAKVSIGSIGIPDLLSVEVRQTAPASSNWRSRMEDMLDQLSASDTGVVMVVDEVDPSLDEMVQTAAVYQQFVVDKRKVALLMAGLPHNVSSLITNKTVSFLRRANQIHLGPIDDFEIERALSRTMADGHRSVDPRGLSVAADAIAGFPYMLQLVGYHAWEEAGGEVVGIEGFQNAIEISRREMNSRVFAATLAELSASDVLFLRAMLVDEGDSAIADVCERLQWSSSQVAQYRRRLMDAGVIGRRARGVVGFELPFFREYLQERFEDEGL